MATRRPNWQTQKSSNIPDPLQQWERPKGARRWSAPELCKLSKDQLINIYGTLLGDGRPPGYMRNIGKLPILAAILGLQGLEQEERKLVETAVASDGERVLDL